MKRFSSSSALDLKTLCGTSIPYLSFLVGLFYSFKNISESNIHASHCHPCIKTNNINKQFFELLFPYIIQHSYPTDRLNHCWVSLIKWTFFPPYILQSFLGNPGACPLIVTKLWCWCIPIKTWISQTHFSINVK